jgi:hypothetical protein
VSEDWLNDGEAQRRAQQDNLNFAKLYVEVFVNNAAGKAILSQWTNGIGKKRTPVNGTLQEYAANEAVRVFIQAIQDQIDLAQSEGRLTRG